MNKLTFFVIIGAVLAPVALSGATAQAKPANAGKSNAAKVNWQPSYFCRNESGQTFGQTALH